MSDSGPHQKFQITRKQITNKIHEQKFKLPSITPSLRALRASAVFSVGNSSRASEPINASRVVSVCMNHIYDFSKHKNDSRPLTVLQSVPVIELSVTLDTPRTVKRFIHPPSVSRTVLRAIVLVGTCLFGFVLLRADGDDEKRAGPDW